MTPSSYYPFAIKQVWHWQPASATFELTYLSVSLFHVHSSNFNLGKSEWPTVGYWIWAVQQQINGDVCVLRCRMLWLFSVILRLLVCFMWLCNKEVWLNDPFFIEEARMDWGFHHVQVIVSWKSYLLLFSLISYTVAMWSQLKY